MEHFAAKQFLDSWFYPYGWERELRKGTVTASFLEGELRRLVEVMGDYQPTVEEWGLVRHEMEKHEK